MTPPDINYNRMVDVMPVEAFPGTFRRNPPDEIVAGAFKEAIESPPSCWLLAEEEQVVAFLSADFQQRAQTWDTNAQWVCYSGGNVVEPDCRRKVVAKAPLGGLDLEAHSRGVSRIELDVWSFTAEVRRAFASLGFRPLTDIMTHSAEPPNQAARGYEDH